MLNQPINVIPSVLSGVGEGVVDATLPLTVSWQVSGNTPMIAYQILIQQNDTDSTLVYDTDRVDLSNPFYGNDSKGNTQTFSAEEITAEDLSEAGIVNGYENGYKILITQWWGDSEDESITQTSPSYFITRATPDFSIFDFPPYTESNPYKYKSKTFTALFEQEQGDTVKTIRWYLYEGQEANPSKLLLDTGDIETQQLELQYDGLFPNNYYYLYAVVQTSNGVNVSADSTIYVKYPLGQDVGEVTVCKPVGENYIQVSWSARSSIDGEASGDVDYENGSIHINDRDTLTYSPLNISDPWTIVWRGKADISRNFVDVLSIIGEENRAYITASNTSVTFTLDGNIICTEAITGHSVDTFTIIITPTHYYIRQDTFVGGTIPRETLYPSQTLYPSEARDVKNLFDGEITYTQFPITSIVLDGDQTCDYVWIESGEISQSEIQRILGDTYYQPIADYNTMFLTSFDSETSTAYMSGSGGNGIGSSIYRREYGKAVLEHVVDTDAGILSIRDYGAKARTQYQYYVFAIGIDVYAEAFGSGSITPQYNNYTLIECIYDDTDGAYHVQAAYPFACNASLGAMSNNNAPNIMQNFTRYPNRQSVNTRYASGTLSALIGTVNQENATYTDSWELADKISAMSTSRNPKFLRDMKGKIWRVETSEAITTEINNGNVFIPIKMTIPWIEVGDADGASIVAVPSDPVYEMDTISLTTIHIDPQTGRLIWETPDNYTGTVLSLKAGKLQTETPKNVYPASLEITNDKHLVSNI